jgi:nitroimidazol reductase NimA-like FMN-containing flavoprotein (pyridoxamine 5'-phosphate oxidase superfamily)/GNAT superfamily N-acetyltransferase
MLRADEGEALALLARAPALHLATTGDDGRPIARTLNAAVLGGAAYFHGAPAGEKMEGLGRRAVATADEIVASVPSYFLDPERACPATTFYRSAHAAGRLETVEAPEERAAALEALMRKHQPEGGHVPVAHDHPLYRKALAGLLVVRLRFERVEGKFKLGQNRNARDRLRVVEGLWARGAPGDAEAVDAVLGASPDTPAPSFLRGPQGVSLRCALGEPELAPALGLLGGDAGDVGDGGAGGAAVAARGRAHLASSAWVGAFAGGALIGTARAVSDRAWAAWVDDVAVRDGWRGRGVGSALLRLLLGHPAVRGVRAVRSRAPAGAAFFARHGFRPEGGADGALALVRAGA